MLSCTFLPVNMSLKTVPVIFIFFATLISAARNEDNSVNKFFIVATTENPTDCQIRNYHCFEELQEALRSLNATISNLQKVKQEIIEETKNALSEKLSTMKQEIVDSIQAATVKFPRDCKEVQAKGYRDSGVYRIQPYLASEDFTVYCDMTTRGGGWTYAVNRVDGSQDFYLNWTEYRQGFGGPSGEYWIGLEHLYHLTNSKPSELLIELVDWDLKKVHAHYSKFKIGNEAGGYKIMDFGEFSGDAGDSIKAQLGCKFSTLDRDQDTNPGNCAQIFKGAWWYSSCFESHLTGRYVKNANPVPFASGLHWNRFHGLHYSLKEARMMIRPSS